MKKYIVRKYNRIMVIKSTHYPVGVEIIKEFKEEDGILEDDIMFTKLIDNTIVVDEVKKDTFNRKKKEQIDKQKEINLSKNRITPELVKALKGTAAEKIEALMNIVFFKDYKKMAKMMSLK